MIETISAFAHDYTELEYNLVRAELTQDPSYDSFWKRVGPYWKEPSNSVPYGRIVGELRKVHHRMLKKLKQRVVFKISHVDTEPAFWWVVFGGNSTQWGDGYVTRYAIGYVDGQLKILGEEGRHTGCRAAGCSACGDRGFEYIRGDHAPAGPVDKVVRFAEPSSEWSAAHVREA